MTDEESPLDSEPTRKMIEGWKSGPSFREMVTDSTFMAELNEYIIKEIKKIAQYDFFDKPQFKDNDVSTYDELQSYVRNDPAFGRLGLAEPSFVRARVASQVVNSVYRIMGEIYDKPIPRIFSWKLNLRLEDIQPTWEVDGESRELDAYLDSDAISAHEDAFYEALQMVAHPLEHLTNEKLESLILEEVGAEQFTSINDEYDSNKDEYRESLEHLKVNELKEILKSQKMIASADCDVKISGKKSLLIQRAIHFHRRKTLLKSLNENNINHEPVLLPHSVGFEIRSCYQIADSKRLQGDEKLAAEILGRGGVPVMLVMCYSSQPGLLKRMRRSGWRVLEGHDSFEFIN